jgi:hypothetical protein
VVVIKNEYIGFKVSSYDNELIRAKAARAKLSLSSYVRTSSLEKEIKVIDGLREMIPELNAIGNNLNQLTVMLRMGNIRNPNLETIKSQFVEFVEQANLVMDGK